MGQILEKPHYEILKNIRYNGNFISINYYI